MRAKSKTFARWRPKFPNVHFFGDRHTAMGRSRPSEPTSQRAGLWRIADLDAWTAAVDYVAVARISTAVVSNRPGPAIHARNKCTCE
jgi:hypothetical protein